MRRSENICQISLVSGAGKVDLRAGKPVVLLVLMASKDKNGWLFSSVHVLPGVVRNPTLGNVK